MGNFLLSLNLWSLYKKKSPRVSWKTIRVFLLLKRKAVLFCFVPGCWLPLSGFCHGYSWDRQQTENTLLQEPLPLMGKESPGQILFHAEDRNQTHIPFSCHKCMGCCDFLYSTIFLLIISLSPLGRGWWKPRISQPGAWHSCGLTQPRAGRTRAPGLGRALSPPLRAGHSREQLPHPAMTGQVTAVPGFPFLHWASFCAPVINIFLVFVIWCPGKVN